MLPVVAVGTVVYGQDPDLKTGFSNGLAKLRQKTGQSFTFVVAGKREKKGGWLRFCSHVVAVLLKIMEQSNLILLSSANGSFLPIGPARLSPTSGSFLAILTSLAMSTDGFACRLRLETRFDPFLPCHKTRNLTVSEENPEFFDKI